MSGIDRELTPDPRTSLFDKHLPDTSQVQRLLRKEGKAHVFNDRATIEGSDTGYSRKWRKIRS